MKRFSFEDCPECAERFGRGAREIEKPTRTYAALELANRYAELQEATLRVRMAAGRVVDLRARAHMAKQGEKDYQQAVRAVLDGDAELKANYALGMTAREYSERNG
jgi:hypothetical protein